jgi:hypothetical protein
MSLARGLRHSNLRAARRMSSIAVAAAARTTMRADAIVTSVPLRTRIQGPLFDEPVLNRHQ